jgi:uncharacterized protein YcbX
MRVHLGRIVVFPIKSLDGVIVEEARITSGGILEHDRVYAIVDAQGKYVNGKRNARVHRLRCRFDAAIKEVGFSDQLSGREAQFVLAEPEPLNRWLSEFFESPVTLTRETEQGFPDDRDAPGPTIVSESSLRAVASWYPNVTLESARGRFRSNLELDGEGAPPFWEDRLFGAAGVLAPFQIGEVRFFAHNPCQRCVVPTRDAQTGEQISGFQKAFMERRSQSLPAWANSTRFNHFYRLAVNTSVPGTEAGKRLRSGDVVEIAES